MHAAWFAEQVGQRTMLGDVKALESRLEALRPAIRELEAAERAAAATWRARNPVAPVMPMIMGEGRRKN